MQQIDITELGKENVFELIGKEWGLVTAGTLDNFNMMTVSWGALGELWGKHVAIIFIRPERYTHDFVEQQNRLTLAFWERLGVLLIKFVGVSRGVISTKWQQLG